MGCSKLPAVLIFAVVVMMVTSRKAEGQPSCAAKLGTCAEYINSTGTPPASCCDPLEEAVKNEAQCLCNLYSTPGLLAGFRINVTQAMLLPGRCNIPDTLNGCKNASSPTSPSSEPPPPATPGNNGVGRIGWTGLPSLLLLWASMMLY